jgi:hypothetical protein
MDEFDQEEEKTLPRWVTIPLGVVLAPFTLLCVIGSASLLLAPRVPPTVLTVSLGTLFLAGSVWVFVLSLKLVFFNPARRRGFISPFGLRVIAGIFAIIPVAALISGTFWEKPVLHSAMTVGYIFIVLRLLGMAKSRSENA